MEKAKDLDFLALVLEELDKAQEAQTHNWLLARLAGPSQQVVTSQLKAQLPANMPFWLRGLLSFFVRFKMRRERRRWQMRLQRLLAYACQESLLEHKRERREERYLLTERGRHWLETEYASKQGKIDTSDVQATYDAVKLCKALEREGGKLPRAQLMHKAMPKSPIPPKAGRMLRGMLTAHNDSIPEAFERAAHSAQSRGWIVLVEDTWKLTSTGKKEGLHFQEAEQAIQTAHS